MRALIAYGNAETRQEIAAACAEYGVDTVEVSNNAQALSVLDAETTDIILMLIPWLDKALAGGDLITHLSRISRRTIDGFQLPHVITVLPDKRKESIDECHQAGVDDFVGATDCTAELIARVKLGLRFVALQADVRTRYDELKNLSRRYGILSEMVSSRPELADDPAASHPTVRDAEPENKPTETREDSAPKITLASLTNVLTNTLKKVFTDLGVGPITVSPAESLPPLKDLKHLVWTPLYLQKSGLWIDLKVECNQESVEKIYESLLGEPAQDADDINDAMGELVNIAQGAIKASCSEHGDPVLTPALPKVISSLGIWVPATVLGKHSQIVVNAEGIDLLFTAIETRISAVKKTVKEIQVFDVLAADVGGKKTNLPKGTMLDFRNLERLLTSCPKDTPTEVIEISSIARLYVEAARS